jgi:alpha-1,3-rhamnosyl/mannosyltransferase
VAAAQTHDAGRGKVVLTGALRDRDLSLLLRGASLEVIPSLYEGFCLPMVEAMACGIPTIVAHGSCLPEISGGVLRYFDPYSVEEMTASMEAVLLSADLQAELAGRGRECAQKFSWDLCAEETLGILEQVARRHEVHSRAAGVAL